MSTFIYILRCETEEDTDLIMRGITEDGATNNYNNICKSVAREREETAAVHSVFTQQASNHTYYLFYRNDAGEQEAYI